MLILAALETATLSSRNFGNTLFLVSKYPYIEHSDGKNICGRCRFAASLWEPKSRRISLWDPFSLEAIIKPDMDFIIIIIIIMGNKILLILNVLVSSQQFLKLFFRKIWLLSASWRFRTYLLISSPLNKIWSYTQIIKCKLRV